MLGNSGRDDVHHAMTPNDVAVDIYVKTAANTTQDKYAKLTLQNYSDVLQQVWDNASKIRNAQGSFKLLLFVYIGNQASIPHKSQ
ncbi:Aste57867_4508 [Aphanomyces stellatus]|uniref:Aste57867_4508 protein n=2 Tax=Aphanomyces stellatus TaxID=120398 RepID=A0A485KBI5_9STRA|nr:hypothetical protein As57867_004495 [Aphanomyces stellatus]VFT81618.1 Aste57867_4508 [Aphanomyces stellatus]